MRRKTNVSAKGSAGSERGRTAAAEAVLPEAEFRNRKSDALQDASAAASHESVAANEVTPSGAKNGKVMIVNPRKLN